MRKIPSLRRHKPTSQAVVTLSGRDFYLGVWPSGRRTPPLDMQVRYEREIAEWLTSGRSAPSSENVSAPSEVISVLTPDSMSVAEILAAYWDHAEAYYRRPDGTPSPELNCLRAAFRPLRRFYDDLPAREFSPRKLKVVRYAMIRDGLARTTINYHVGRIKRVFVWAVENELIPPSVSHGLQAVRGLRAGRRGEGTVCSPARSPRVGPQDAAASFFNRRCDGQCPITIRRTIG
jgi:hypothetical protein